MFTGLVEETGEVLVLERNGESAQLELRARSAARGLKLGDSLAVNGCCLTVARLKPGRGTHPAVLGFDLLAETLHRTNLGRLVSGDRVNLERALKAGDALGGHFVSGHVDGVGTIRALEPRGQDHRLEVQTPAEIHRLLVGKGSIAVDGISLTVADVLPRGFRVWLIPHTMEVTHLSSRKVGDRVNLESDLLAKHVDRLISAFSRRPRPKA